MKKYIRRIVRMGHMNICATCNNLFETSNPNVVYCSIRCAN